MSRKGTPGTVRSVLIEWLFNIVVTVQLGCCGQFLLRISLLRMELASPG
ncbi:MAG: hypothetical protein IJI07_10275 [Flexilinea sp.]|nr:hypothetical protein [Flexilinea sp.]